MPSFDIVSKIDMSELKNAVSNSMKEISQRYDFKGSISNIELENDFLIVHTGLGSNPIGFLPFLIKIFNPIKPG